ncbi:MAG: hypothetical protein ACI32Q_03420 [Intestinibaculum porci]|uniref:hypothetical protein n=1 Tax=Intestinibaculum porci TaxID=2487118 RepID=UPI003F05A9E2
MSNEKTKLEENNLPEYAYLDLNAKRILHSVNILMLIFRALIDEFKDMSDEALTALLKPVKEGLENFSPMIREGNPELDHNDQKRILDLLYVINRKEKPKMFVDVELQSTKERFVEIRSTQYITAILAKTHFVENELAKVIMIWINMAPAKHEEGTILVNPPLLYDRVHDVYCPREALKACPTVILVNLYDIRKEREAEIRSEKEDIIAILSTIFSTKIDHKKKGAILKERGFTIDEKDEQEMKDMESWSKGIFESMRDDIQEEVKREVREEGREEGRLEGVMLFKKVNHLLAKGMRDEEILKALPDVTAEFLKEAREIYEEAHQLSGN